MRFSLFIILFSNSLFSQSLSPERVTKIKSSVVRITIDGSTSIGTGFFINDKGLIVTCMHVVKPAINNGIINKIFAELNTGEIIEVGIVNFLLQDNIAGIKAVAYDFCLLAPTKNTIRLFPFLKVGNFDTCNEGDEIYTCGYPIGIKNQFITKGIISTKYIEDSNKVYTNGDTTVFPRSQALLDITLNKGNSGGPVVKIGSSFNDDEVVGIADFIITPIGSQSEQIVKLLLANSGGVQIGNIDPNFTFAKIFDIISSLSIGVSGCVSINHLTALLAGKN